MKEICRLLNKLEYSLKLCERWARDADKEFLDDLSELAICNGEYGTKLIEKLNEDTKKLNEDRIFQQLRS